MFEHEFQITLQTKGLTCYSVTQVGSIEEKTGGRKLCQTVLLTLVIRCICYTVLVQYTVCSSFRTVYTSCALLKTTSKPTNDSYNHVSDTKHALREFFFFGFYFREEKKILPNFFGFYSHNVAFTPNTLFYFS